VIVPGGADDPDVEFDYHDFVELVFPSKKHWSVAEDLIREGGGLSNGFGGCFENHFDIYDVRSVQWIFQPLEGKIQDKRGEREQAECHDGGGMEGELKPKNRIGN